MFIPNTQQKKKSANQSSSEQATFIGAKNQGGFFGAKANNPFFGGQSAIQTKKDNTESDSLTSQEQNIQEGGQKTPLSLGAGGGGGANGGGQDGGANSAESLVTLGAMKKDGGKDGEDPNAYTLPEVGTILYKKKVGDKEAQLSLEIKLGGRSVKKVKTSDYIASKAENPSEEGTDKVFNPSIKLGTIERELKKSTSLKGFTNNYSNTLAKVNFLEPAPTIDPAIQLILLELNLGKFKQTEASDFDPKKSGMPFDSGIEAEEFIRMDIFKLKGVLDQKTIQTSRLGLALHSASPFLYQLVLRGIVKLEISGKFTTGWSPADFATYKQQSKKIKELQEKIKRAEKIETEVSARKKQIKDKHSEIKELNKQRTTIEQSKGDSNKKDKLKKLDDAIQKKYDKIKQLKDESKPFREEAKTLRKETKQLTEEIKDLSTKYTSRVGKLLGGKAMKVSLALLKKLNLILAVLGLAEDMYNTAKLIKFWSEIDFSIENISGDKPGLDEKGLLEEKQTPGDGTSKGQKGVQNGVNNGGSTNNSTPSKENSAKTDTLAGGGTVDKAPVKDLPPVNAETDAGQYINKNIDALISTFPEPVQMIYNEVTNEQGAFKQKGVDIKFDESNIQEFLSLTKNLNAAQAKELIRKLTYEKDSIAQDATALLGIIPNTLNIMEDDVRKYGPLANRNGVRPKGSGGNSPVAGEGGKTPVGKDFDVTKDLKGQNTGGGGTSLLGGEEKNNSESSNDANNVMEVEGKNKGGDNDSKLSGVSNYEVEYPTVENMQGTQGIVMAGAQPTNPVPTLIRYYGLKGINVNKLEIGELYDAVVTISLDLNGTSHEFDTNAKLLFIYKGLINDKHYFAPTSYNGVDYDGTKLFFNPAKPIGVYGKRIKL